MNSSARELLRETLKNPPPITVPGRRYKEAHSSAVYALIEQVLDDQDRLERHAESLQDTLKMVINQSQLAMNEMRRLSKGLTDVASSIKRLPAIVQANEANGADAIENGDGGEHDVDLQGQ
jgi:tRNA C32,U32 (ribose-2'-O)-methylase TrmJ